MKTTKLKHQFVELIPKHLEDFTLYISIPYDTAVHKCACGCGSEVVTPLSKNGWSITYNGEEVSLNPSIGNFNFTCESHYWIQHSRVEWVVPLYEEDVQKHIMKQSWWKRMLSVFS